MAKKCCIKKARKKVDLRRWINKSLPALVDRLERAEGDVVGRNIDVGLNLAGQLAIYEVLDDLLAALFPGFRAHSAVSQKDLNIFIGDRLRHVAHGLAEQIEKAFRYRCRLEKCALGNCADRAAEATVALIGQLHEIRGVLLTDIEAAYLGDPAAKSLDEILMAYPCIEAIATYRIAHALYAQDVPLIPRVMTERAHHHTGIDIHPGATIGPGFFIDHGTGVVIGETCTIGRWVKIYQGVTLGALSFPVDAKGNPIKGIKRHPDIGDNVTIYAGATILGGETVIGAGSVIGGNVWLTHSVPPGSKVTNVQPAPIVKNSVGKKDRLLGEVKKTVRRRKK